MYTQNAQGVTWKIRTLKSDIKMLGHENQVIDGLKFDVEGHEWQVVENFMDTGVLPRVCQLMTEWHLFPEWPARAGYVHLYQTYSQLRELGFRKFCRGPHPKSLSLQNIKKQGDCEFVNTFFNKEDTLFVLLWAFFSEHYSRPFF